MGISAAIAFARSSAYKKRMNDVVFKEPVAVAVSGGMDSLYSLLALKDGGAELFALHAVFLPSYLRSPDAEAVLERLKRSAASFGVKLHVVDLSAAFEEKIIRPFVDAYMDGKTPNPCAICNHAMKFGLLWEEAARLGAGSIATGHYVKLVDLDGQAAVMAGEDESKEQSYFLALTPLQNLARAVFPLARRKKREIAAELARRGVEVPQKGESQEICFITNNDYRAFLSDYAARRGLKLSGPGPALLPDGQAVGRHGGLWGYTQGQRRGLGIAWEEPLYVLGKNVEENALLVGPQSSFGRESCLCSSPNFFVEPSFWPQTVLAKTRYRQRLAPARAEIFMEGGAQMMRLVFLDEEARAPSAPGQVAAVYSPTENGLRLLAGAVIIA